MSDGPVEPTLEELKFQVAVLTRERNHLLRQHDAFYEAIRFARERRANMPPEVAEAIVLPGDILGREASFDDIKHWLEQFAVG